MTFQQALLKTLNELGGDAWEINDGSCAVFAKLVQRRVRGTQLWRADDYAHFFLKYRGRFYDAECLSGVTDPKRLPFYRDLPNLRKRLVVVRHRGQCLIQGKR